MVSVLLLQLILMGTMFLSTAIVGIVPTKLLEWLRRNAAETSSLLRPANGHSRRWPSLTLCLLSCFTGGVFFGTGLVHLLPEAVEDYEKIRTSHGWKSEYPFGELMAGIGFFVVFLVEELVVKCFPSASHHPSPNGRSDSVPSAHPDDSPHRDQEAASNAVGGHSGAASSLCEPECCEVGEGEKPSVVEQSPPPPILTESTPHAHSHEVRSITLILALSFHSVIEGLAFGVTQSSTEVLTLFVTVIVHKLIVAFSLGLQLARTHARKPIWVFVSIILFAAMSPLGGLIGIGLQESSLDSNAKDIFIFIVEGLAVGTFFYITFFEVLIHERNNDHPSMLKLLVIFIGFGLMSGLKALEKHDDGDGKGNSTLPLH